jgi:hypothetical protein
MTSNPTRCFDQSERELVARALRRAMQAAPTNLHDAEETKAILLTGITDAADRGVRDENLLIEAALSALLLYDDEKMDAVMRDSPL